MKMSYWNLVALIAGFLLTGAVAQNTANVTSSAQLQAALQDTSISQIYLTGLIKLKNETGSIWNTVLIDNRNVSIDGDTGSLLDFNLMHDLIIVQNGSVLEFSNMYVRGSSQTSVVNLSNLGPYSVVRADKALAWPSVVLQAGSSIFYNHVTAEGHVGMQALEQKSILDSLGVGEFVSAIDDYTLSFDGNHVLPVPLTNLSSNTSAGFANIIIDDVLIFFPPDASAPAPSMYYATPVEEPTSTSHNLKWWHGLLMGIGGTAIVLSAIFAIYMHYNNKRLAIRFQKMTSERSGELSRSTDLKLVGTV